MRTSRKLTCASGITIPKDMRLKLGWLPGKSLDLETTEDGALVLRPHINRCCACDSIERVHHFRNVYVCEDCINTMKEEIS